MSHPYCLHLLSLTGVLLTVSLGFAGETAINPVPQRAPVLPEKTSGAAPNEQTKSPAELRIEEARKAVKAKPDDFEAHNALALALARRARETGNAQYYDSATESLKESFRIVPGNPAAEKMEVWLLLGKHDFGQALKKARELNQRMPDDLLVYALLADAAVEMGEYEEAEKAVQWNFDMKPGDIAGLTRGAYLRELFGDIEGALELMRSAYEKTAESEVEDRAWTLTQMAHLNLLRGEADAAERLLTAALGMFPRYHYALAGLGKVRMAQGKHREAALVLMDYMEAAPCAESCLAFAHGLKRAGQAEEAKVSFEHFESLALKESGGTHNHNRELAFYYADIAGKPAEALRFAAMEAARRQDVNTLHCHAWALYVNGKYAEARREIEKALKPGVRDPVIFYHAGMIAAKDNDLTAGQRYLNASLSMAPQSEVADLARKALAGITVPSPPAPPAKKEDDQ